MSNAIAIRILEKDNNRRGDLFGRLMNDLFLSLGYDDVRLNIARSGREIDIEAEHRLERRLAIAECKALNAKAGGKEINAFAGKLRPERGKHPGVSITPYFISLSGFTETSVDQETESGHDAVILVDGPRVVTELIKGRILVPLEKATEKAGQCAADLQGLVLDEDAELLAHERGWIWAVYYTQGKQRTHLVLVHADGTPVATTVARDIIAADRTVGGTLHKLTCLNPEPVVAPDAEKQATEALAKYYQYLATECGYILLDGLPADAEVGSQRLRLENLFVPLHLLVTNSDGSARAGEPEAETAASPASQRLPVSEVLAAHSRLAILASPGGGKSTLLKRLAVAYADPDRRMLADDRLPDRSWLPLFFRCRELRDKALAPFSELVDTLAARSYMGELTNAFRACVECALRNGEVLLLVDGLDEISDTGARTAFVRNLRTFLAVYPRVSLVVTSREAGFRHVASLLAAVCLHTRLADFDADDIRRLSVAWHREVVGGRPDVVVDAERLAATIADNDRIRRLAVNPLLLTTLLLVKRWVGQLPTRRSILYGKAVEVLLMTWNVEGHEPIEQDEALPQLCYIAYTMMQGGVQKISRPHLTRLLRDAREQLSAELAYARIGIPEFIERIEHRSSLLMMTGYDVVDGTLTEFYEFRHLTFQEYLTAKAIVEIWYPPRQESNALVSLLEHNPSFLQTDSRRRQKSDALVSLLEPHFEEEKWREVIPLAAVLAGRKAEALVQRLTEQCMGLPEGSTVTPSLPPAFLALGNCLADEVQITPSTLQRAMRALIVHGKGLEWGPFMSYLACGKYGAMLCEEAGRAFLAGTPDLGNPAVALAFSLGHQMISNQSVQAYEVALDQFRECLTSAEELQRCEGALGTMLIAFSLHHDASRVSASSTCRALLCTCADTLVPLLFSENVPAQFAACWALGWIGACRVWTPPVSPNVLARLFTLWLRNPSTELYRQVTGAFAALPLLPREAEPLRVSSEIEEFIAATEGYRQIKGNIEKIAVLIAAYYLRSPWSDVDLARLAKEMPDRGTMMSTLGDLIVALQA